jgi:hypothetical protein
MLRAVVKPLSSVVPKGSETTAAVVAPRLSLGDPCAGGASKRLLAGDSRRLSRARRPGPGAPQAPRGARAALEAAASLVIPHCRYSCSNADAGPGVGVGHRPSTPLLSGMRELAQLPETLQSRPGHETAAPSLGRSSLTLPISRARRARQCVVISSRQSRQRRESCYAFSSAPSGAMPVVAYRHNAISSLRATATIPIRRDRR